MWSVERLRWSILRFPYSLQAGLICALALLVTVQTVFAAPPIRIYKWGSSGYSVPYEFDSFGEVAGARMGSVVATHSATHAYPKYVAHPGLNCDGNNNITETTGISTGRLCAEKKTSMACIIPGVSGPYYTTHCQLVQAVLSCPAGYTWNTSQLQCVPNGSHDPDKEPNSCNRAGNPVQIGLGTKYETQVDYVAGGSSPLRFERTYSSKDRGRWSAIGQMWRHTYSRSVVVNSGQGTEMATVRRPDGTVYRFVLDAGVWTKDNDVTDTLTPVLNGSGVRIGWTYKNNVSDETESYDIDGRLVSIVDRAGLQQALSYDTSGRLQSVTDAGGRSLTFAYDVSNRIISMTDPAGNVYLYTHDGSSRLTAVTYPDNTPSISTDNPKRLYHYENSSFPVALTGITDELGNRYATFVYDTTGRAIETKHLLAGGAAVNRYTLTYPTSTTATVTDPLGVARTHTFQTVNRVRKQSAVSQPCSSCGGGSSASSAFDANGNVSSRMDYNGNRTNYTYDLTRNLETQRVEGLTAAGASTGVTRTMTTAWHASFRLPTQIAEPKRITTLGYDSAGNLTSRSLQATTDLTGAFGFSATPSGPTRTWTYTHTYSGTVPGLIVQTTVDGPRTDVSDVTTYSWDNTGNLTAVVNPLGHTTSFSNYDAHGRAQTITDPNGVVSTLAYDVLGRLLTRSRAGEVTSYEYDAAGQLKKITAPDSSFISYTYDNAHRLTQLQDNLGNKIVYTLDALGNRTKEDVSDPANVLAQTRSREFNTLNRLVKDIGGASPTTQITQYGYDTQGNLTTVTDPLGKVTTYQYDALNRLAVQIDPAATGSGSGGTTQFGMDGVDQTTSVTDPRSLVTGYAVDGLGNVTQQISPDTGVTSQTFDAAGNRLTQTDARNVAASFTYDALDRVLSATWTPPGGAGMATVSQAYTYDVGANAKGKLTSLTDNTGSTTYTYNAKGRLASEARVIAGVTYTTSYSYDAYGRLSGLTYPSGRTVTYTFDARGRVSQIDTTPPGGASQAVVQSVTYHPFGGIKGFSFGNGAPYSRNYDLDGRANGYSLGALSRTVGFDAASRITSFTHNNATYDQTFGYDNLGRLTSWTGLSTNQGFTYDAVHNRTSQTIGATAYTYTMASTSNRLASVGGPVARTYTYDAAGNVNLDGTRTFAHDARGRLIQATHGAQVANYAINGLGQRVLKTPLTGTATAYHFDQKGMLIAESTPAGAMQREYVYLDGTPVAVINATAPTTLYNLHTDHLDTVRVITDSANAERWRWDSDPFGSTLANENPSGLGVFAFYARFPGQYFDTETGTHYNYYRDYDPGVGRYVQSDPIGLGGGINTYAYVGGDPLTRIDPTGTVALPVILAVPEIIEIVIVAAASATAIVGMEAAKESLVDSATSNSGPGVGESTTDPSRALTFPDMRRRMWVCTCRADCNDNIPGNCPKEPDRRYAYGTASGPTFSTAVKEAKRTATHNLSCQPKHVPCNCTGPNGERRRAQ